MELYIWLTGLFFIICGFLVRKFPVLIAGYNTMKKEQKEKVDIKGLVAFLCKWFVVLGCLQIVLFYLFRLAGIENMIITGLSAATFVILVYMLIGAQKYDHNKRHGWQLVFIIGFLLVVAGSVIYNIHSDSQIPRISLENGRLAIDGIYGVEKPVQDIRNILLTDTLPAISYRSNGLAVGSVQKGHFKQENGESCLLFLVSGNGPYIRIVPLSGESIYLNLPSPDATRNKYEELKENFLAESVRL